MGSGEATVRWPDAPRRTEEEEEEKESDGRVLFHGPPGHLVFITLVSLPGERAAADPWSRSGLGFLRSRCCKAVFSR